VSLRLVLDTSAILVYAHGGDDAEGVGELIREVAAEHDAQFGALAVCRAEATLRLSDDLRPMVGVPAAACWPEWRSRAGRTRCGRQHSVQSAPRVALYHLLP
jgi:hypothetical protein